MGDVLMIYTPPNTGSLPVAIKFVHIIEYLHTQMHAHMYYHIWGLSRGVAKPEGLYECRPEQQGLDHDIIC